MFNSVPPWRDYKIKENKGLRGDVLQYVAQVIPQFDAEIVKLGTRLRGVCL